jgi:hypothetical protein
MRGLRVTNRVLSVAVGVTALKAVISGPRASVVVVGVVFALLLIASLRLTRQGWRVGAQLHAESSAQRLSRRRARSNRG